MLRSITTTSAAGLLAAAFASMSVATAGSASADELLSDLRTEEVQAGVLRVVGDEFRDLPTEAGWRVAAGLDDSIWLLSEDQALQVGRERSIGWPADEGAADLTWWGPTPDGALHGWASNENDEWFVASFAEPDTELWMTPLGEGLEPYALMPDGRAWAHGVEDDGLTYSLSRLTDDRWVEVAAGLDVAGPQVTAAGELWLGSGFFAFSSPELRRFDDGEWVHFEAPERAPNHGWTVGPDGSAWTWAHYRINHPDTAFLARLRDGVWTSWEREELPPLDEPQPRLDTAVAPDGALWVAAPVWVSSMNDIVKRCRGVTRFDGLTPTTYLEDHCVQSLSIGPDGSVWLRANEAGRQGGLSQRAPFHTYAILPAVVTGE